MPSVRRKIAANIFYLASGQGLSWVLTAVYVIIVPRYLGPANLGILTMAVAISSILTIIGTFGTKVFIMREVARSPEEAHRLVGAAILLCTGLTLVNWLAVALVLQLVNASETTKAVLYLLGIACVVGISTAPLRAALQGLDKMHFTLFETLIDKGLGTLMAFLIVGFNLGIIFLAFTSLLTALPMLVLYWWAYLKYSRIHFSLKPDTYKYLIKNGSVFLVLDVSFSVYLYLDSLLLSVLTNETTVGYYGVPYRLLGSLMVAPVIIGQALLPTLSRMSVSQTAEQAEDSNTMARNVLTFMICVSPPMAVGATVMAGPFINLFYTSQFAPSVPVLIILSWATVPLYLGIGLYQVLVARDKQGQWTKAMVAAIFINGGLNLALINYFQGSLGNGAIGAALSLLLTELIIGVYGLKLLGREVANRQLVVNFLKSMLAAGLMGLLIWPLRDTFILIPVAAGGLIYLTLIVLFFGLTGQLKGGFQLARRQFQRLSKKPAA